MAEQRCPCIALTYQLGILGLALLITSTRGETHLGARFCIDLPGCWDYSLILAGELIQGRHELKTPKP